MAKTVLITGAAKRIGSNIATYLAKKGWNIAIHYHHSENEAVELGHQLEQYSIKTTLCQGDLSDTSTVKNIIDQAVESLGPLTCLVNNASIFKNDSTLNNTEENWQQHMNTNLRAPMILSEHFAKQLPEGEKGNIINLLDYCVWRLPENFTSYSVSKTGLWTLTQIMAMQLAPHIRVNGIGPGNTLLNPKEPVEHFEKARESTPLKTGGTVEEVCRAVDFFLNMPSVTGQMIALDGGKHLMTPGFY